MDDAEREDSGGQPSGWWRDRRTLTRVIGLCALAFFCMLSYAVARPACESLFLDAHGSEALPRVWILVAVFAAVSVAIYNRFSTRVDLVTLYGAVCVITGGLLALLIVAWTRGVPFTGYALYIWKDIYIVILVEIFYSFANTVFPIRSARWFYGLFGVFGSLGGIVGNLGVGELSKLIGTEHALWTMIPILTVCVLICWVLARRAG
ncbi:MAG: Npt1/Npt2 family nucleotide transporter, partial [Myxococcota bacterium]|nr:Npt1/Npt2 family nucleotide transporter [Myxococcota bacterium]